MEGLEKPCEKSDKRPYRGLTPPGAGARYISAVYTANRHDKTRPGKPPAMPVPSFVALALVLVALHRDTDDRRHDHRPRRVTRPTSLPS